MNEIYHKISELCRSNNISVSQLCKEIGVSRSLFSELKAGRTQYLSPKNVGLISDFFEIPTAFLYGEGVFENWREIVEHLEDVFNALGEYLPRDLFWHEEDDKYLFPYLQTQVYYGGNIPLFVNWLYECVKSVEIYDNEQLNHGTNLPRYHVVIRFNQSFRSIMSEHNRQKPVPIPDIKVTTIYDAYRAFLEDHGIAHKETNDDAERALEAISFPFHKDETEFPRLSEDEAELLDLFKQLQKSGKRQLLGKAYELLDAQNASHPGDEPAPPDANLAVAVTDSRIKK